VKLLIHHWKLLIQKGEGLRGILPMRTNQQSGMMGISDFSFLAFQLFRRGIEDAEPVAEILFHRLGEG
jgi:hypothetical protein